MEQVVQAPVQRGRSRGFILGSLSLGHGASHLYDMGFPVFMPVITQSLGLSYIQVATLLSIRQVGGGLVSLGGGALVDTLKSKWGLILTGCMAGSAIAYALIGASVNFPLLVMAVILVSVPGALWHLPAAAAISQRFPDRRGFAIAMHGFGSNIGNVLGPLLAGALLTILYWRHVLFIYAAPSLVLAGLVWWSLKDVGKEGGQEKSTPLSAQFAAGLRLLKNPIVLGLIFTATLRGIGLNALFHWAPFYLTDTETGLGMSHFRAGFHYSLLAGMGIVSAPVLGILSDKFGRKAVLVPGLALAAILSMLVVSTGDSVLLAVVLAGMGLGTFALHQIIQAAVLDVVGRGTEATAVGLIFGINGLIGAASPFLATWIINNAGGLSSIFYYSGILTGVSAVVMLFIPLRPLNAEPAPSAS
jgi:MFS family permease